MPAILAALPGSAARADAGQAAAAGQAGALADQAQTGDDSADPPGGAGPVDTAKAMEQAERLAIQSDLAWVSLYNGAINGEASDRMVAAIKAFQKDHGAKETGVLNAQERQHARCGLQKKSQDKVGWRIVSDATSGARIGLPSKLVPLIVSDVNGTKWSSATGTIQIEYARRKEAGATTATVAASEKKLNARQG